MILIGNNSVTPPVPRAGAGAPPARTANGHPAVAQLEVTVSEAAGEAVVRLEGEASFLAAEFLDSALLGFNARRPLRVCLDLSGLRCISCLAMGVLASFSRGVVRAGGRVRLGPRPAPAVHADLQRAGLLDLLGAAEDKPSVAASPAGSGNPSDLSPG
jgi:anti-anti-sigma factor